MPIEAVFGPAADIDATDAYLFECDSEPLFAITRDATGSNLPLRTCPYGWRFNSAFALGVREAMPRSIDPEPVLRGLRAVGYYIWREGYGRNPPGTTQ
jgi:hypothetical protein